MGNTETVPDQKLVINGESMSYEGNSTGHDIKDNDVDSETETDGKVHEISEQPSSTDGSHFASSVLWSPNSLSPSNRPPQADEENIRLWQEVALRYQQILYKEYKMLNLPMYPVQCGGIYMYYVPVVIGRQSQQPGYAVGNESTRKIRTDDEDDEEVIDVDENVVEMLSDGTTKRPHDKVQPFERFFSSDKEVDNVGENCENLDSEFYLEKNICSKASEKGYKNTEKHDVDEAFKFPNKANYLERISEGKDEIVNRTGCKMVEYYNDSYVQPSEGFIRIYNGFTIEYYPLAQDTTTAHARDMRQSLKSNKMEIRDLKVSCLAKQEGGPESLKLRQNINHTSACRKKKSSVSELQSSTNVDCGEERTKRLKNLLVPLKTLPPKNSPTSGKKKEKETKTIKVKPTRRGRNSSKETQSNTCHKRQFTSSNTRNIKSNENTKPRVCCKGIKSSPSEGSFPERLSRNKNHPLSCAKRKRPTRKGDIIKASFLLKRSSEWANLGDHAIDRQPIGVPHEAFNQDEFLAIFGLERKCEHQSSTTPELIIID